MRLELWIVFSLSLPLLGCGPASPPAQQVQSQSATSGKNVPNQAATATPGSSSRVVPPTMGGDFSFVCPADGTATISFSSDVEMNVFLLSEEWAQAAQKINDIPGLKAALDRKDEAAVNQLIESVGGPSSPTHQAYFFDGDVNLSFDLPKGRSQRTFRLLRGKYRLMVTNKGDKSSSIEVTFVPTP